MASNGTMSNINVQRAQEILAELIALPTVNPMGRPCDHPFPIERPLTEYLQRLFQPYRVRIDQEVCSAHHENLAIYIPGRNAAPWTLLESHMDTVPADDWLDRAFRPRLDNGRIYGRGACDDKGPLASMVLAVLDLLESGKAPPVGCLPAGLRRRGVRTDGNQTLRENDGRDLRPRRVRRSDTIGPCHPA